MYTAKARTGGRSRHSDPPRIGLYGFNRAPRLPARILKKRAKTVLRDVYADTARDLVGVADTAGASTEAAVRGKSAKTAGKKKGAGAPGGFGDLGSKGLLEQRAVDPLSAGGGGTLDESSVDERRARRAAREYEMLSTADG